MLARLPRHRERGQTLPLWTLGALACLSMALFLINYANLIRWQVRAQNAADSVSSASLSPIATYYNDLTMAVYAANVAEFRLRYLDQAIVNNLNALGCSAATAQCDADYDYLVRAYDNAQAAYVGAAGLVIALGEGQDNVTQFQAASTGAWQAIVPGQAQGADFLDCGDGDDTYKVCTANTDTAFTYYPLDVGGITGVNGVTGSDVGIGEPNTIDAAACVDIPLVATGFLKLPNKTFRAVGRSALGLIPISETISAVNALAPSGGSAYQPNEDWVTSAGGTESGGSYYTVDFSKLSFTLNFYTVGAIAPYKSFHPSSFPTPGTISSPKPCPSPTP
jgi:hypothetical protein